MHKILYLLFLPFFYFHCTSEKGDFIATTDEDMIKLIAQAKTYYQNNSEPLAPNGNSVHGDFTILFNKEALESLGNDGKLAKHTSFKEGSVIVKNDLTNKKILLMLKKSLDPIANRDWVWGEYNSDSSVYISVNKRGSFCVSCHSTGEGVIRDYTRIFEF